MPPSASENGIVDYNGTMPSSVAVYKCMDGYEIPTKTDFEEKSKLESVCKSDGKWSIEEAPICQESEFILNMFSKIQIPKCFTQMLRLLFKSS